MSAFIGLRRNHYQCIYADPPWKFEHWGKTTVCGRDPERHYPVMGMTSIISLPVYELCAEDCALFLWATNPMLPQALAVIEAWGFKYKTVAFSWAKQTPKGKWHIGLGYWTRANSEICFLATRGNPKRINKDVRQLIVEPRREHSRKPDRVATDIERLVPGPYLELFARTKRPGWDVWGNQVDKFGAAA